MLLTFQLGGIILIKSALMNVFLLSSHFALTFMSCENRINDITVFMYITVFNGATLIPTCCNKTSHLTFLL